MAALTQQDLAAMLKKAMGGGNDTDSRPGSPTAQFGAGDYDQSKPMFQVATPNPVDYSSTAMENDPNNLNPSQASRNRGSSQMPQGFSQNGLVQTGQAGNAGGSGQAPALAAPIRQNSLDQPARTSNAGGRFAEEGQPGTHLDPYYFVSGRAVDEYNGIDTYHVNALPAPKVNYDGPFDAAQDAAATNPDLPTRIQNLYNLSGQDNASVSPTPVTTAMAPITQ